jgi:hypothetical protein
VRCSEERTRCQGPDRGGVPDECEVSNQGRPRDDALLRGPNSKSHPSIMPSVSRYRAICSIPSASVPVLTCRWSALAHSSRTSSTQTAVAARSIQRSRTTRSSHARIRA